MYIIYIYISYIYGLSIYLSIYLSIWMNKNVYVVTSEPSQSRHLSPFKDSTALLFI